MTKIIFIVGALLTISGATPKRDKKHVTEMNAVLALDLPKTIPINYFETMLSFHEKNSEPYSTTIAGFDTKKITSDYLILLIHGSRPNLQQYKEDFFKVMSKAFLEKFGQVLSVDWTKFIITEKSDMTGLQNLARANYMGITLGHILNEISDSTSLYIVADDLGTVVAASLTQTFSKNISRIYGINERHYPCSVCRTLYLRRDMAKYVQLLNGNDDFLTYGHTNFYASGFSPSSPLYKEFAADVLRKVPKNNWTFCYSAKAYKDKLCKNFPTAYLFSQKSPMYNGNYYFVANSRNKN